MTNRINEHTERSAQELIAAHEAENAFAKWLVEENEEKPLSDIKAFELVEVGNSSVRAFVVPATVVGLPYPDLSFGIRRARPESRGSLVTIRDNGKLRYLLLLHCVDDPYHDTDVAWSLPWTSFVHEFVHYLDMTKGYGDVVDRRAGAAADSNPLQNAIRDVSAGSYYNDPLEFNAHYLQGIDTYFTEALNGLRRDTAAGKDFMASLDSYAAFVRRLLPNLPKSFDLHLDARFKRKLARRLYDLYCLLRPFKGNRMDMIARIERLGGRRLPASD